MARGLSRFSTPRICLFLLAVHVAAAAASVAETLQEINKTNHSNVSNKTNHSNVSNKTNITFDSKDTDHIDSILLSTLYTVSFACSLLATGHFFWLQ